VARLIGTNCICARSPDTQQDRGVPNASWAVHATEKNGKQWLTMNATKDGLKGAVGYKYDRSKATWVRA
jgi:hypothetical protein